MRPRLIDGQYRPHPGIRALKGIVLTITCALVIAPFVAIVATSLADQQQIARAGGMVLWPETASLSAYTAILSGGVITRAAVVSVGVTVVGTSLSLFVSTLLAYALSRPYMAGRGVMLWLLLATLLFTPGMIPTYLTVKQLGLIDSWWALILPMAVSAFNVIVIRAFFQNVPGELIDSARIDGANEWMVFSRICIPLSKAVLAVVGLFYAVGYWNNFFNALLYLNDSSMWPLQLVLRTYVINGSALSSDELGSPTEMPPGDAIQMAILVISIVPILCVYPFLQKHFAKGVLTGAVKG
ncbi:carbohydrate ABC transporter permease [Ruania alkalisoli]|uniref:Carbohydrate ABC transporter permease n=2 Tax=Ruania alkalisoli TaxID=2779775 RepID=A0A7M1SY99_9MICO|nr:carbohydrate ABC transporter permease [Ruania alkalisoli]